MKPGRVAVERALSKLGLASRTQTREWVLAGRLKVNEKTVKDPLYPVIPEKDRFSLDGKIFEHEKKRTIVLYKPGSVVTTRKDEKGRRTVFDILPREMNNLHPVGRLDMATTGLLILTNDTKLSSFLSDPANGVPRTYVVSVRGEVSEEALERARKGITDGGELLRARKIALRKSSGRESHLIVELTEGKNREIRRLFEALGNEVIKLKRVAFGNLGLDGLEPGGYRELTEKEIENII